MTYSELRRSIEVWTGNTNPEFLSEIDRIIRQAESKIGMLKKLPDYQQTIPVAISGSTLAMPAGFISVDFLFIEGAGNLELKDQSFLREAYPDSTVTGPLRYFAMQDAKTVVFGPAPDGSYSGVLGYFSKWPSLVDLKAQPTTETFISQNFEAALLHGCLYYSALFRQDADIAGVERNEMLECLGLIKKFGEGRAVKQEAEKNSAAAPPGELN